MVRETTGWGEQEEGFQGGGGGGGRGAAITGQSHPRDRQAPEQ